MSDETLIELMDKAAAALLSKISGDASLLPDGERDPLPEQAKVFQVVAEWLKVRHTIDPPQEPEKGPTKFDRIKRRFNGEATRRGRSTGAAEDNSAGGAPRTDPPGPGGAPTLDA